MDTTARPTASVPLLLLLTPLLFACLDGDDSYTVANTDFFAEEDFTLDLPLSGEDQFVLLSVNGNIQISGDPEATSIVVEGRKRVETESVQDAEAELDNIRLEETREASRITLEVRIPGDTGGRNYIVFFAITVPSSMAVGVGNINGNINIGSISNDLSVANSNGGLTLSGIHGDVFADIVNGPIDAGVTMRPQGAVFLRTVNGTLELDIPTNTSAFLLAATTNGGIAVENLTLEDEVRTANTLEGRLGEGSGDILLETVNGQITIRGVEPPGG